MQAAAAAPLAGLVAAAKALSEDLEVGNQLKVLVLGDCPTQEIADRFGFMAEVVAAWESLFFDVRFARQATTWILDNVITPEQQRGNGDLAARMKFAHAGGPVAAKTLLDAEGRVALKQGVDLFNKKIQLHLKFDQAQQLSLETDRDKMFFIRRHGELLYREQRLRIEEQKLEQRCQKAFHKQKVAEARLELAREREQARAERAAARSCTNGANRQTRRKFSREAADMCRMWAREERTRLGKENAARSGLALLRWA